jgi:hypothetical protein
MDDIKPTILAPLFMALSFTPLVASLNVDLRLEAITQNFNMFKVWLLCIIALSMLKSRISSSSPVMEISMQMTVVKSTRQCGGSLSVW